MNPGAPLPARPIHLWAGFMMPQQVPHLSLPLGDLPQSLTSHLCVTGNHRSGNKECLMEAPHTRSGALGTRALSESLWTGRDWAVPQAPLAHVHGEGVCLTPETLRKLCSPSLLFSACSLCLFDEHGLSAYPELDGGEQVGTCSKHSQS